MSKNFKKTPNIEKGTKNILQKKIEKKNEKKNGKKIGKK